MSTTFNVISLGVYTDIDTVEGDFNVENADSLVGLTFGGVGDSLVNDFVSLSPVSYFGDDYQIAYNDEFFSIDGGPAQTFDSFAVYTATVTYVDGTTATLTTAVVFQDTAGNLYFAPETSNNEEQAILEAGPIQSITLDSVFRDTGLDGLTADRETWNFVTCFVAGTLIGTPDGDAPIESLKAGDLVQTMDHGAQTIRWIGSTTVPATGKSTPVVISKDALGNGLPERDLLVSQQHRILIRNNVARNMFSSSEVLVAAKHLVALDGIDIVQDMQDVTYFHFLCSEHEIVFAEGAPSESLYTGQQALKTIKPEARNEIFLLFPELENRNAQDLPISARPLVKGRQGRSMTQRMVKNHRMPIEAHFH